MPTGILALQGNFRDHSKSLELISKEYIYIKNSSDIENIDSLILPGGESSSMIKIQENEELFKNLRDKINEGIPTLGTCAGLILLSKDVLDGKVSLNLLNCVVERNAYGRQNDSFEGLVTFNKNTQMYCFIRAPRIISTGKNIHKIAYLEEELVGIRQENITGFTFHPELTNDDNYLNWLTSFIEEGSNVGSL